MPFDPNDEIVLRLPAIDVQQLLNILNETTQFPNRITTPLMTKINMCVQAQSHDQSPVVGGSAVRGNSGMSDVPGPK